MKKAYNDNIVRVKRNNCTVIKNCCIFPKSISEIEKIRLSENVHLNFVWCSYRSFSLTVNKDSAMYRF